MTSGLGRAWALLLGGLALLMSLSIAAEGLGGWANNRGIGVLLGAIGSRDADFLSSQAQRAFELRQYAAAEDAARKAALGAPLHQKAARLLGMSQIAQGRTELGNRTIRAAGLLGWQDVPTQAWLMLDFLQRGDPQNAIYRADALARRGGMRPEMLQMMTVFATDPVTLAMLVERLELGPQWRRDFFRLASAATPAQIDTLDMLLRRLQRGGVAPPARDEVVPVARQWVRLGDYDRAQTLVSDLLPGQGPSANNPIGDGGFANIEAYRGSDYPRTPFDWDIGSGRGATASIAVTAGDGALYVQSNGAADAVLASKMLRVPAGDYLLAFVVESPDAEALQRFYWSLACMPNAEPLPLEPDAPLSAGTPRTVEVPFTVPTAGCDAQMLRLHARAATPRQTLTAEFDDIAVGPQR